LEKVSLAGKLIILARPQPTDYQLIIFWHLVGHIPTNNAISEKDEKESEK